jgi:hypothetical protein
VACQEPELSNTPPPFHPLLTCALATWLIMPNVEGNGGAGKAPLEPPFFIREGDEAEGIAERYVDQLSSWSSHIQHISHILPSTAV